MAVEIERKFLVSNDAWKPLVSRTRRLRQAYLATTGRLSIRVRIDDERDATLTIKAARSGAERNEYEYAIPLADAQELMAQSEGAAISKCRHIVPLGPFTWEVDVFEGENAGLVIAEIELDHAARVFERPAWLGHEVTGEQRYYNAALSALPYSKWQRP